MNQMKKLNGKLNYQSLNPAKKWFRDKSFYLNLIRRCLAEFVGTMLYVFIGTTAVSNFLRSDTPHLPTVALAYGFTYAGLVAATVNIRLTSMDTLFIIYATNDYIETVHAPRAYFHAFLCIPLVYTCSYFLRKAVNYGTCTSKRV